MADVSDYIAYKTLVAVGDDGVYYEMASGELVQLSDSSGDIDSSDQFALFECMQKACIANGSILRIADFVNTKLTHSALDTAHAHGDLLTQATSEAQMIVDFTNADKTATYGYVTTGTFTTDYEVTGSGSGSAFTPSAVTANPHWYNWTVYPGGNSGELPDKAYLGCSYQGRAVLSGNPNEPEQWYMSKQSDPWNWLYDSDTAQSAIAGGNGDFGQAGDIITALIPYKDDYLILGCANTIKVIVGNPAAGGSMNEVDLTRGIYGAKSWCFDGAGNLYFWSQAEGLCMLPTGFGQIEPLSAGALPNIVEDEEINPTVHRICLAYDRKRIGIIITITNTTSGVNSNYFYSLKTNGFFPFSFPSDSGVYSLLYYPSNTPGHRDLLYGCKCGYVGVLDDATKNDSVGTATAINAHFTIPITKLNEDDREGKVTSTVFELAGGEVNGTYEDSGDLTYRIYTGDDAETVAEQIRDSDAALISDVITGAGRKTKIRSRVRGAYLGLKLSDNTSDNTFGVNRVLVNVEPAGRIR